MVFPSPLIPRRSSLLHRHDLTFGQQLPQSLARPVQARLDRAVADAQVGA